MERNRKQIWVFRSSTTMESHTGSGDTDVGREESGRGS